MSDYRACLPKTHDQSCEMHQVDLFSGQRWHGRLKTRLTDDSDNYKGKKGSPVRKALRYLKNMMTYFQKDRVERLLEARKRAWEQAYEVWKASGAPMCSLAYAAHLDSFTGSEEDFELYRRAFDGDRYTPGYDDYQRKYLQYLNDLSCYQAVLSQGIEPAPHIAPGVYEFSPAYKVQMSGRVGCVGGMLQSCSREMKHAAFQGIPHLHNYDLKASQPTILLQKFEEAVEDGADGIDPTWLRRYVNDPEAKTKYANLAGLDVDVWKSCFMAIIMGATLPVDPTTSNGDLTKKLREAVGEAQLAKAYQRLEPILRPLKRSVDAWHDYLVGPYFEAHSKQRGRIIHNEAGVFIAPEDITSLHERKAKLAAFVLQGHEASFIHTITILGNKYDYEVIQNEHDGVITLGVVPQQAIDEAARLVVLKEARLVEKPLCDASRLDALRVGGAKIHPLRGVTTGRKAA